MKKEAEFAGFDIFIDPTLTNDQVVMLLPGFSSSEMDVSRLAYELKQGRHEILKAIAELKCIVQRRRWWEFWK